MVASVGPISCPIRQRSIIIEIVVEENRERMGLKSAQIAGNILRDAIARYGVARIVVATGSSQFEVLNALINERGIDWNRVDGFHLDEYVGLAADHPASFCGYLKSRFVDRVPLRTFHYLDGRRDPSEVCQEAEAAIRKTPIDVAMIGIGENAHLAFNDPPADMETRAAYHVVSLDEACRLQQVGEGWFAALRDVPERAISMTIFEIMRAKNIVCSVPDSRKAWAVAASVDGPPTPNVPASILRDHPNATLVLDRAAASDLRGRSRGV
jgi:glucosamine-6-phosphate deaminase